LKAKKKNATFVSPSNSHTLPFDSPYKRLNTHTLQVTGNHEAHQNFTQYCHRFEGLTAAGNASGSKSNMFFSWDHKLVHFIGINTEVYKFYNETQSSPYPFVPEEQLAWLEKDLEAANARRDQVSRAAALRGMVIRPACRLRRRVSVNIAAPFLRCPGLSCSATRRGTGDFEVDKDHPLKQKLNTNFTGFTALAEKYKVDLYLAGHIHIYQRFYSLLGPAKHEPDAR
jgi:3',5'-cyclic AMP phosphodiesterase CpdA